MTDHATPDVTIAVTQSVAQELIARAGFERDVRGRVGRPRRPLDLGHRRSVAWALVVIAEQG